MFKRKSVDISIFEFKPLVSKNLILGDEEKLANVMTKPLAIVFMKSENGKGIGKQGNRKYIDI